MSRLPISLLACLLSLPSFAQADLPPIASAGIGRSYTSLPSQIQLDGSHSIDPEGSSLTYQWQQTAGPVTELESVARPVFNPTEDGSYTFELTVSDENDLSATDSVTYHVGLVQPIADAGLPRYIDEKAVQLDGTGSVNPNSDEPLVYAWKQLGTTIFGSPIKMEGEDTATPTLSVLSRPANHLIVTFELTVSCGGLTSEPSTVDLHLAPKRGNRSISLENETFDPEKPTIISFGGGNCDSGGELSLGEDWHPHANLISGTFNRDSSSPVGEPTYIGYGDQLIVLLSELAPYYSQPIQVIGFSTGNMPAYDVALQFNTFYQDPRYAINRITMLDSACRDFRPNIEELLATPLEGEPFWIDNYYSQFGRFREGIYNVEFPTPPAQHDTPSGWYSRSWDFDSEEDNTILGGAYFSLAGPGRYHQLNANETDYHLGWEETVSSQFPLEELALLSPETSQATLPAPVQPIGPEEGAILGPEGALLSCEPTERAVRYQVVIGPEPSRVTSVISESALPPSETLLALPFAETYWSVRALDAQGSYAFSPPRLLRRDTDGVAGTRLVFPNSPTHPYQLFNSDTGLTLRWLGQAGNQYEIESSADLRSASWQSVDMIQASNEGEEPTPLEYSVDESGNSQGFYRIVLRE